MSCCGKKTMSTTDDSSTQERPAPTVVQIVSAAKAILTAKRVAPSVINARIDICRACVYRRQTSAGYQWCSLCGCIVDGKKGLTNLASYEEGDGVKMKHGCHHPDRATGKGWPLPPPNTPTLQDSNPSAPTPHSSTPQS